MDKKERINSQREAMKSCPFCGERAVIDKVNKIVYCVSCGCEFRADLFTSIEEIIDKWNKRVSLHSKCGD